MSQVNIKLFEKIKEQILAEPSTMNMRFFCKFGASAGNECGTTGCIAGWAMLLMGMKKPLKAYKVAQDHERELDLPFIDEDRVAAALLGISNREGRELFFFYSKHANDNSPYQELSQKLFNKKPGSLAYAKIVCEAIDLCVERCQLGEAYVD